MVKHKIKISTSSEVWGLKEDGDRIHIQLNPGTYYEIKEIDPASFKPKTKTVKILKNVVGRQIGEVHIIGEAMAKDWINRGLAEVVK